MRLPCYHSRVILYALVSMTSSIGLIFDTFAQDKGQKSPPRPSITWVNPPTDKELPLPPGTSHDTFHSTSVDQDIGFCVYLPPNYDADLNRRFPVIYNLHGNGGNELTGLAAISLLHEQIAAGKIPPMIMTCFNGGKSTFYKDSADGRFPIESIFMREFIPHVDEHYRTIADGTGRCIEGFSMGGRGATRLAMKYPAMFCSLNCQAGNVPHLLETFDQTSPEQRKALLLGVDRENWADNDVYSLVRRNRDAIASNVRIQVFCGTKDGGHIHTIRDYHALLLENNIDHTYMELAGFTHNRKGIMKHLADIWFDHHVDSLRQEPESPK